MANVIEHRNELLGDAYYEIRHETGLTILVYPKAGYSTSYAVIGTNYGSIDDALKVKGGEEKVLPWGTAHFLEHKLFESEELDAFERFAETGASANAYTTFDRTCYLFSCSSNFRKNLEILLDFVQHPYFTQPYTASRGAQKYHPEREQTLLERVADFDFISVRETSFKEYLEELLDKEVPVLCDPIFLMGKDFYEDLAKQPDYVPEQDFVVIYLAMNQNNKLVKLASDYAEKHGLELTMTCRLTRDPELKELTSKADESVKLKRLTFGVANNDNGKEKDPEFFDVVCWDQLAIWGQQYLKKGNRILLTGIPHNEAYEKDGQKRTHFKIVADKIELIG